MINITDPVMQWAFLILVSVVLGTCLLMGVAFVRRWKQIRLARYVHNLRRKYRPIVAKVLAGARNSAGIEALRELPLADLELLLDPLLSRRKVTDRSLVFLQALCVELGLIEIWQSRVANEHRGSIKSSGNGVPGGFSQRAVMRRQLRAKSIRNLGMLRHRPSWPLLVNALQDRHVDIQLVALRSLAALGAPESFPLLRERLHALIQQGCPSLPLQGLQAAMVCFDFGCVPALGPSLRHPDRQIRLRATEILREMVCREAARQPGFTLTSELLTPPIVELWLAGLAVDTSAEVRARAAEIIVFIADPRATSVLCDLLRDHQWFVRLRTVRALGRLRQPAASLYPEIRECLRDPHWRVREAAIRTLIAIGREGKHQLYEHFLTSLDRTAREQIVEVIERTGLMSALLEEYSKGTEGVEALMVEQLASAAAPRGVSGVLRTLNPEIRQNFLQRFLPYARTQRPLTGETQPGVEWARALQQGLNPPSSLAA